MKRTELCILEPEALRNMKAIKKNNIDDLEAGARIAVSEEKDSLWILFFGSQKEGAILDSSLGREAVPAGISNVL